MNDNPQAFPRPVSNSIDSNGNPYQEFPAQEGMTILDYFAAKVIQGFCSDSTVKAINSAVVKNAYVIAELMILERKKYLG